MPFHKTEEVRAREGSREGGQCDLKSLLDFGRAQERGESQARQMENGNSNNNNAKPKKSCFYCVGEYSHSTACPAQGKTCRSCSKIGHFVSHQVSVFRNMNQSKWWKKLYQKFSFLI